MIDNSEAMPIDVQSINIDRLRQFLPEYLPTMRGKRKPKEMSNDLVGGQS